MPVSGPKLVADVGRYTGFDSARADGDEAQSNKQAGDGVHQHASKKLFLPVWIFKECQCRVAHTVDNGEPDDGAIFSEQSVSDDRTDQRQCVYGAAKQVVRLFAGDLGGLFVHPSIVDVQAHNVDVQDGAHAIEAEAFAPFVSDDVLDSAGPSCLFMIRTGPVLGLAHRVVSFTTD